MSAENAEKVAGKIMVEYVRANGLHGNFHSLHEGYAALLEEKNELWDEIKLKHHDLDRIATEAIQVAAMGMKIAVFALDLKCKKPASTE